MTTQIEINGFRNLEHHVQEIPESPIVVLRGANGAGKSTIRRVLQRMLGDANASHERGATPVATARLTRAERTITLKLASRFSVSGSAPIRLAAGEGRLLSDLIGPDDDDRSNDTLARKTRVDALARLANLDPTPSILESVCTELARPFIGQQNGVFSEAVADVKRRLEAAAREHKSARDKAEGTVTQIRRQLADLPTPPAEPRTPFVVQQSLVEARRELYQTEADAKARDRQIAERAKLATAMAEPSWSDVSYELETALAMTKLEPTPENQARCKAHCLAAAKACDVLATSTAAYRTWKAALDAPTTGPTSDDVTRQQLEVTRLETELTDAQNAVRRKELEAEHDKATTAMEDAGSKETAYRTAAKGISGRIADLIRQANLETLSLDPDGEVIARQGDAWVPYASMSFGERVYLALSALIGADRLDPDSDDLVILTLTPSHWAALDLAARQVLEMELSRYEGRVILLTEEPGDDAEITAGGVQ